jgi:Xaa-Pro aminopeptidase
VTPRQFDDHEYATRLWAVRALMAERNLDLLIVWARGGGTVERHGDVLYLTDYYPAFPTIPDHPDQWCDRGYAAAVISHDRAVLCPDDEAVAPPGWETRARLRSTSLAETVCEVAHQLTGERPRIGLAGYDTTTGKQLVELDARTADRRERSLHYEDNLVRGVRSVKSDAELTVLRRAACVARRALDAGFAEVIPGATEAEITGAMWSSLARDRATLANSFVFVSGAGSRSAHARIPTHSDRPLEDGDVFTVDLSGSVDGYFFDLARSRAVGGDPTRKQAAMYDLAKRCVDVTVDHLTVGSTVGAATKAGYAVLSEAGYDWRDDEFTALGHGLGLGFEEPWLTTDSLRVLVPGQVLAIERFCMRDGVGATFERDIEITAAGPRDLAVVPDYWLDTTGFS